MFKILYLDHITPVKREAELIYDFLQFESWGAELINDKACLKYTRGLAKPVVVFTDMNEGKKEEHVVGFYGMVDYIRNNGLCHL